MRRSCDSDRRDWRDSADDLPHLARRGENREPLARLVRHLFQGRGKGAMMLGWEKLTPAGINIIAMEIREGAADPKDARRLLEYFCECVDSEAHIPYELLRHLSASFKDILSGARTVDAALGLARKKNRPKADGDIRSKMALGILERRMNGMSHQDAVREVSKKSGWGKTVVGDAWREYQGDALNLLRMTKPISEFPWDESEIERLAEIFKDKEWFIASEKSPSKPK